MAVVVFDPVDFKAKYPQFVAFSDDQLTGFFTLWENAFLDNTDLSPVAINLRATMFNLGVAHLCQLQLRGGDSVGNILDASEGSVKINYSLLTPNVNYTWYNQTQYGATYSQIVQGLTAGGMLFKSYC